jgi:hypothetical protein
MRRLVPIALLLALAAPASALAQSAGDNQYSDPFAQPPKQPAPQPTAPQQAAPQQAAPQQTAQTPAAPSADSEAAPVATATSGQPQLARTGLDVWPLAALGAAFLVGGLLLRRALDEPDPSSWPYPVRARPLR